MSCNKLSEGGGCMVSDGTKRCRRGRESGRTHSKCCSSVVERVVVAKEAVGQGVPVEVVAALLLGVFVTTYLFF